MITNGRTEQPLSTRAFVLGNGPSLSLTPFHLLKNEVTFATNRIRLIYKDTDWRPTYYVRSESAHDLDPILWTEDVLVHLNDESVTTYCNVWFTKWLERNHHTYKKTPHTLQTCSHYTRHYDDENCPHLWHLPIVCSFGSSVNVAIQIAVRLGYSPIYLIGCDLGYKDGEPSHFEAGYEDGHVLRKAKYANLDTLTAHMIAKRSSPVPIYNAGIGGELEVYDRVRIEDLF